MTVQPATRPKDGKVHLVATGDPYALCGRPAGGSADHWTVAEHTPPAKERCRDCVIAGEHLPRARPSVPIHPWNPRL